MKLILYIFLLCTCNVISQTKPVEIETIKKGNKISFFGKNNSSTNQDVTFSLKKIVGLKGYSKPIKKRIAPQSKKLFLTVTFKGKYSYATSFQYVPFLTKSDIAAKNKKLKEFQLEKVGEISNGIVVFSVDDCSRCHRTTSYLLDNNIDFKYINTSDKTKPENNRLMWTLLKENGITKSSEVTMPVVLVDGKLSHSHDHLLNFLLTLND